MKTESLYHVKSRGEGQKSFGLMRMIMIAVSIVISFGATNQFCFANVPVRIKDITTFQGVRENQLVGYGLVVGLNGTGDSIASIPYTKESLVGMLERLGVNIRDATSLNGKNIAAVMVTATLPPFARHGSRIDINVSSLGDAKDLRGGTLLVTPLLGADGDVYAVGQGALAVGGFSASGKSGTKVTKGVPTAGKISNGAIIEKEIGFELANMQTMNLSLRNPDFTTAKRIADVINKSMGDVAQARDPSTVNLTLPADFQQNIVGFLTKIEQLTIVPDQIAKIIIDDQDGIIVMGQHTTISTVAVTHGNITIRITETPQVSQPNPFTQVTAATKVDRTDVSVKEENSAFVVLDGGVNLQELVKALNAMGATAKDMIAILRSIKASGAIQADIEVI